MQQANNEGQKPRPFNPREHLTMLKSREGNKEYLGVQWRLVWFREAYPHGTIETEMIHLDLDRQTEEEIFAWNSEKRRSEKVVKQAKGFVVFKAIVKDGMGGVATGTKSEKAASFPDYIEKAETGAIGRALAALGYGTQFAPELDEAHRIVDAPVDRAPDSVNGNGSTIQGGGAGNAKANSNATPQDENAEANVTEKQLVSIRKLCQHLGKGVPENVTALSFLAAKNLIQQLSAEYNTSRQQAASSR